MKAAQLDLYVRHSDTSREAAASVRGSADTWRVRVFRLLDAAPGGLTDEEMQLTLGLNPSSQRPRRVELVNMGLVVDSKQRRLTSSGRKAVVWVTV